MLIFQWAIAQMPALKFNHFGKADGLNQSSVNAIYQDSEDILWIGNFGGINAFDGYNFISYTHEFGDSTTIADNSIWAIFEDSKKNLWFGTKSSLALYNRQTDDFRNFYLVDPYLNSGTVAVKSIFEDASKRLFVGSEGKGLFEFDHNSKEFIQIHAIPTDAKISSIAEGNEGIWVGTEDQGLFLLDLTKNESKRQTGISASTIWSLHVDKRGQLWIGTDQEGLLLRTTDGEMLNCNEHYPSYEAGLKIKTISENDDYIWIGSATEGLSLFSKKDKLFYSFEHNEDQKNSLADNDVSDIHIGSHGVVYLGYYLKGFDKTIFTPFHSLYHQKDKPTSLSNNNVYSMYKDKKGQLWFGTFGGGLNLLIDKKTGQFKTFRNDPLDPHSISHDWVRIMYEDSNENFWIGTWGGGLNLFDRDKGRFIHFKPKVENPKNSLSLNIVTAVFEDSFGKLWIGTYGGGINIYRPETNDFYHIKNNPEDSLSLSDNHITSFYEDDEQNLWICTYGGGLNRYDRKTGTFERFIPDPSNPNSLNNFKLLHIYPKENFFWITTLGGGLNKFYPEDKKFYHYTEDNGLANNSTMGMLEVSDGTFWINTNHGLSHFDPSRKKFTNYTSTDGLGSDDFNLEAHMSDESIFYFGGKNGITYFNPDEVKKDNTFPKVLIRNVFVENEEIDAKKDKLTIPYDSRIAFDFVAVNPKKTSSIQYSYLLEGTSKGWEQIGTQRHLEFLSLRPGVYKFKVRTTNEVGEWNDTYESLGFTVSPPWYMTWYFRISAVLVFFFAGLLFYRRGINRLERQNKFLEDRVTERTKTISEKNEELKAAWDQQQELESFKNAMVHMIAHDLKNPLVSIIGRSSSNFQEKDLESIQSSGRSMLNLIEDMLDVQRFEEAKITLDIRPFELNLLIDDVINEALVSLENQKIVVVKEIPENLKVNADLRFIGRVITNLFSNAIKFSNYGGIISFKATVDSVFDKVRIMVQDNGDGIPQQQLHRLFDKYTQIEKREYGGSGSTGLGLFFCKKVLEAHNEEIGVDSKLGEGSSFYFTLPLKSKINKQSERQLVEVTDFKLEKADDELIRNSLAEISNLEIYETGAWFQLLERLNKHASNNFKRIIGALRTAIVVHDRNAFLRIKEDLVAKIKGKTHG